MLALWPTLARANDEAQAHYQKGLSAFGLGHYGMAAVEYERAFAIEPQAALLFDAAQAHKLAGHDQRALELYQNYLRIYGEQIKNRREVEEKIAELKSAIATKPAPPSNPPSPTAPPETTAPPVAGPSPVTLRALTPEWKEPCPARLRFVATVTSTTETAAPISYRTRRSDGARSKPLSFTPSGPGNFTLPPVMWSMGSPGKHYDGWMQVEILSPFSAVSNQVPFSFTCP
jgi:tetratricopeptide (TPR) repeat protein